MEACLHVQPYRQIALCIGLLILSLSVISCEKDQKPNLFLEQAINGRLQHPSDLTRFQGAYVATELFTGRLVYANDITFKKPRYFDPKSIGKELNSPHFLWPTPRNTLLISEGWGNGIVEISNLKGKDFTRFTGPKNDHFLGPHGVCESLDGWIYVADSLNSRLVRFRDLQGGNWQVFADLDKRISYGRQILCRKDGIWLANSYERRKGLNPGNGSNVLRITDFNSGKVEELAAFAATNITGLAVLEPNWFVVSLWVNNYRLLLINKTNGKTHPVQKPNPSLGVPYGLFTENNLEYVFVAWIGNINSKINKGGVSIYKVN